MPREPNVEWLRGYATALASTLRMNHDGQAVRWAMKEDNVSLDELRSADVIDADMRWIEAAYD